MHRAPRIAIAVVFAAALAASIAGSSAADEVAPRFDPVRVFHPLGICGTDVLELEVFDRETDSWQEHPRHPRILGNTCQTEDAGILLNELRVRCAVPFKRGEWNIWRVGVNVWSAELMERCTQETPRRLIDFPLALEIESPRPGTVLESADLETQVEGRVRLGGRDPGRWDLVFVVDASQAQRTHEQGSGVPLSSVTQALRGFTQQLGGAGSLRAGLVSFSTAQEAQGAATSSEAFEMDVPLGGDLSGVELGLERLVKRPESSLPGFATALSMALAEVTSHGDAQAQPAVVMIVDGRAPLPFGSATGHDPAFRRRAIEAAQLARSRQVPVHVLALGGPGHAAPELMDTMLAGTPSRWLRLPLEAVERGLAALPFHQLESLAIHNTSAGTTARPAELASGGRFSGLVRLREGENALQFHARATNGAAADARVRITLDNTRLRAVLIEQQLEFMRRVRARGKRVVIEAAEP